MITTIIAGTFLGDWKPASEDWFASAEEGTEDASWIDLINKLYDAPQIKSGRGFRVKVELTENEAELLKGEAKYRMEYWSLMYQDCKADIDRNAHTCAKKLYLSLGGTVTEKMAGQMGIKVERTQNAKLGI